MRKRLGSLAARVRSRLSAEDDSLQLAGEASLIGFELGGDEGRSS